MPTTEISFSGGFDITFETHRSDTSYKYSMLDHYPNGISIYIGDYDGGIAIILQDIYSTKLFKKKMFEVLKSLPDFESGFGVTTDDPPGT